MGGKVDGREGERWGRRHEGRGSSGGGHVEGRGEVGKWRDG